MISLPFSNSSTQSLNISKLPSPSSSSFPSTTFPQSSSSFLLPKKALTLTLRVASSKSSSEPQPPELSSSSASEQVDEWLKKLPEKTKPLYSHSLPCIEAWLRKLGFYPSKEDRAVWFIELLEWHAQLSLDVTDLYIRYLKTGPGNLEKDVERRFSYALSREDIENAILGGP